MKKMLLAIVNMAYSYSDGHFIHAVRNILLIRNSCKTIHM